MSKKVINRLFSVITITSLIFITCSTSAKADTTETDFSHTDFGTVSGLSVEKQNPYVEYAGVDHYPVLSGDTIKINMSSKYDGDYSDYGNYDPVQYRAFIAKSENEDYTELTNGYSNAIPAYNEFTIEDNNALTEGKYKVMIFVKSLHLMEQIKIHMELMIKYIILILLATIAQMHLKMTIQKFLIYQAIL